MSPSTHLSTLTCDGAQIGDLWIPAFEVFPGEIIKLTWESLKVDRREQAFRSLCSAGPDSPLHATGRVIPVELAMPRSRWREWMHRERPVDWLTRRSGADRQSIESRLKQLDIDPGANIASLAATPRWLMGLEYAFTQRPAAVIFHTAGLDPLGIQKALATVAGNLGESAGVYLASHPDLGIQEPDYSAVLSIVARERQTVPLISKPTT